MKKILCLSILFAAVAVQAQTTDCEGCEDRLKEAFAKDPLIAASQNGQLQTQQDLLRATKRSIDLTLQMCGACLPDDEKTVLEQQQSSLDEAIRQIQEESDETSFRPDESKAAEPEEQPQNSQPETPQEPDLPDGRVRMAR